MSKFLRDLIAGSFIGRLPIRVKSGVAKGALWSLYPWTSYWRGTHESEEQEQVCGLYEDWTGMHVWDLGSHYGIYAVGLGCRVGPTGSVAAFEPNPLSFSRLKLHVTRNKLDHVSLFPCAVSENQGQQRMFYYEGMETTTSHLAYENETWNETIETADVATVRLDDLVASGKIFPPDFIKVDVEGHGHKALLGAKDTLRKCRPTLVIGMHSDEEIAGIMELLSPLQYDITPIDSKAPKTPTVSYDYIFKPINLS